MSTTTQITVADWDRMIADGSFLDRGDQKLELIFGEIVEVPPANPPHCDVIDLLMYWSVDNSPRDEVRVRIQNDLGIEEFNSVPAPDLAWMKAQSYRKRRPTPRDVLLLIEVSDSSLRNDRTTKAELYASARVQDYWIVNLVDWCVEVHRRPRTGTYREITSHNIHDSISPLAFPDISLEIGTLFSV